MKSLVPFLVLASLAATPALAQPRPGDGRGDGHAWRAEGRFDRGQGQGQGQGRGSGGGRFEHDNGPYGRGGSNGPDGGGRPDGGRGPGGRGFPGANGVLYAQPSDNHNNGPGPNGWRGQQNEARDGVRQGRFQSMGEILNRLRQREPGQQLDAGLREGPGGRPVYRVRWAAKNGRLIDYTVDAQTGAILSEEGR